MAKTVYTQQERAERWDDLVRRLKLAAPNEGQGQALVSVRILVQDGCPVFWSEPTRMKIEPRRGDLMALLSALCDDECGEPPTQEGAPIQEEGG